VAAKRLTDKKAPKPSPKESPKLAKEKAKPAVHQVEGCGKETNPQKIHRGKDHRKTKVSSKKGRQRESTGNKKTCAK
jgi:hypothetical protein